MPADKSDIVLDLRKIFKQPENIESKDEAEAFTWGADDHELFDQDAVEFDIQEFMEVQDRKKQAADAQQSNFQVLGEEKFVQLKKIQIRPGWISSANVFDKDIADDNCGDLKSIPGLKKKLYKRLKEHIKLFFPVQNSVLSYLLPLSESVPIFPPRDVAISAPTGSGKTLCYILPIINSLEHSDSSAVFAVIVVPLQLLAIQIAEEFKKYNAYDASVVLLAGTQDYATERRTLFPNGSKLARASIIVATPDRLVEHLCDIDGKIDLNQTSISCY